MHVGDVVCEPRHATWATLQATRLLEKFHIARVAADPARADGLQDPGGWGGVVYFRMHGSPHTYFSSYSTERLEALALTITNHLPPTDAWAIFDNTASGAAASNALDLIDFQNGYPRNRRRMAEEAHARPVRGAAKARNRKAPHKRAQ
jgi:uncharacterized protein YecE (DUF72 family)